MLSLIACCHMNIGHNNEKNDFMGVSCALSNSSKRFIDWLKGIQSAQFD